MILKADIMGRIRRAYAAMNDEVHKLMAWKRARGICQRGISCMEPCMKGSKTACQHHHDNEGVKRGWKAFSTPYGQIRLREINLARSQKKREKQKRAA